MKTTKTTKQIKKYSLTEAIELAKKSDKASFNSTIEVHFNLNLDVKKPEQSIRYTTSLPNGTGKVQKVAVFSSQKVSNADLELTEDDLDKILKGEIRPNTHFDILVSEPRYMPKLAKVARVLGPAGVMPNPKAGTVAEDVQKAVDLIKKGRMEIRTESNFPLIHTVIGKKDFTTQQLEENFKDLLSSIRSNKPSKAKPDWIQSTFICATMGPSYEVDLNI